MKSVITISGIVIINGAVVNIIDCRCNSFCRFGAETLAEAFNT